MQTTTYKLDITPGGVPLTIHISQYDVGLRQYTFQPFTSVGEFAYVPGATVTLEATKPDGYAVIHDCTYSSDGTITYTVQEQLAAKPGKVWSKIVIRVDNDVLGTGTIVWLVDEAGVKDSAIVSESDVSGIHGMVDAEVKNAMYSFLPTESTNGVIAHFEDGADDVPVKDLKIGIVPQQSGSGDPSPSNVRPITGWTGATITHTGSNLVKFAPVDNATHKSVSYSITSDGKLTMSGTATANSQPYYTSRGTTYSMMWGEYPAGTYTMTCLGLVGQSSSDRVILTVMKKDGTTIVSSVRISGLGSTIPDGTGNPCTFTSDMPFKFGLYILINSGSTVNCTLSLLMEVGETVHEYETLNEQTYPISWETEAGAVYGGTLDVTTGVLTVTHICIQLTSSQTWASAGSVGNGYRFYQTLNPACDSSAREIKTSHWTYLTGNNGDWGTYQVYNGILFIKNQNGAEGLTSVAAFKSWLDANNAQVCYPLATPQIYQLTPTEVRTLLGINNIWSDTGDTEVEYKADAQAYMDKRITATKSIIAGIETEYKATKNYTTGQFLIVGDNLYKVTANIASGATIAVGTNVVSTTVAEQLIALANA